MNMFINFESNSATNLNEEIRVYCKENKLVEVSRSSPTSFVLDANAHIIITSELRPMTEKEIYNLEKEMYEEIDNLEREMKHEKLRAKVEPSILAMKVEEMGFSTRTYNILKGAGIKTMEDILLKNRRKFFRIRGFGPTNDAELSEKLDKYGVNLSSDD